MNVWKILKNAKDRAMKALTGTAIEEFKELAKDFEKALEDDKQSRYEEGLKKGKRQRKPGAGSKGRLETPHEKLFFILVYFKCYPSYDVLGSMFDMDGSNACRNVRKLIPILEKALGEVMVLPKREIDSIEELFESFPGIKDFIIDGTERSIQRPKDNDKQKDSYSGKKKKNTGKNTIIVKENKEILYLGPTFGGKNHDYGMFKEEFPPDAVLSEPSIEIIKDGPRVW